MFLRVACLWCRVAPHRDLYLPVIMTVEGRTFSQGPHGHPDQVPYIITWKNRVELPIPLIKAFLFSRPISQVLVIRKKET